MSVIVSSLSRNSRGLGLSTAASTLPHWIVHSTKMKLRFSVFHTTKTTAALPYFLFWASSSSLSSPSSSRTTAHAFAVPSNVSNNSMSSQATTLSACTATSESSATSVGNSPLSSLVLDNSWPRELSPETTENLLKSRKVEGLSDNNNDNRTRRPVFNGHFVLVKPTGLPDPELLLTSDDVAYNLMHLTPEQVESEEFVQFVSGNFVLSETWATPYALSIMGSRYTSNCPYGTGNGYGDGRAISIAEFNGYELQLKGAGKTPFHRGADGRAVLRSSIREFLASEAMHYLGIETTRALSLVKSQTLTVQRPWYSDDAVLRIPEMNDLRLAQYPEEQRRLIIQQLRTTQKADPNILITESCAITCRVATSFVRIGHIDLFARRVEQQHLQRINDQDDDEFQRYDTSSREWMELEQIIWHACKREYKKEVYDPFIESNNLEGAATRFLELAATKIADMVAGWVRVGFAQGNFNADNCLVGGKTMDYGPFGWIEEFSPLFAKWTGSGQHFGFLNQPSAGLVNYQVLVESVVPVIVSARGKVVNPEKLVEDFMIKAKVIFERKVDGLFNIKMGLPEDSDAGEDLWDALQPLMRETRTDWTLFWRQLTYVMRDFPDLTSSDYEDMMELLEGEDVSASSPFYEPLTAEKRREFIAWIKDWREALKDSKLSSDEISERMRMANPKFVLREWMLVDAYSKAANGDDSLLKELFELVKHPYEEGTPEETASYYRRAPESSHVRGGTAFMS
jgi:serine/tyrosine/threonine adenylyltransferase